MNVSDCLTHIDNPEDVPYLRTKLLDVNMRLFAANDSYRSLVGRACDILKTHCLTKMDGYKLPHGVSGANLGIPWNIIAIAISRGQPDATALVMLNPKIWDRAGKMVSSSNCGSIRLTKPIKVERWESILVSWHSPNGYPCTRNFHREDGALTIQHEIDHNNGILITDRVVEKPYNYQFPA